MIEIREMLRLWLEGRGLREVARLSGTDRKTVRRYVERAQSCGVDREGGAGQLTDELLTAVIAVRRKRPNGKSQAWETIAAQSGQITAWLDQGLTLTKIHILLGRRGVVVSYRTLNRYARTELGFGKRRVTVRVADCEPGSEVQVDFGRLGLLTDAEGRGRVVKGLIFTAVYSRHMFVYPTHRETLGEVIAGFEAAWTFFGGVFAVVIPDNMKAIVDRANATEPRLNDSFREYAESRGFVVDPARIRSPQDKPRVERCVPYARSNFFAGEQFRDLDDCRERAARWCREVAGMRVHGTTRLHPAEVFATDEHPKLKPLPDTEFDIPAWAHPKVAPDRHVQLNRALYSVPGDLVGQRLTARVDTRTVKLYWRGELIKVHPVVEPGRRRHRSRGPARRADRLCDPRPGSVAAQGIRPRPAHRRLRGGSAGTPLALDQDAAGLPAARPHPPTQRRGRRRSLPPRPGSRSGQRRPDRPHAHPRPHRGASGHHTAARHGIAICP
ncbi:IS21 family transposase [Saccharopolyspora spinosa]|uniref:IS21 family transposase n=1 Tax=Saccharopolyspora spinosa TaxID=60894 RepID=UPI00376EB5A7